MGVAKRKFNVWVRRFQKPYVPALKYIASLMPSDFQPGYFVNVFQKVYPDMWDNVVYEHDKYRKMDQELTRLGKKIRYSFPLPHIFILRTAKHILLNKKKSYIGNAYDDLLREEKLNKVLASPIRTKQPQIDKDNLRQCIEPNFAKQFEKKYFSTQDVTRKAEIINELSLYNCETTKSLLFKINNREYCHELQQKAYMILQTMGENPILRKKVRGKNKYKNLQPDKKLLSKSPSTLIEELNNDTLQKYKEFDVFLSHSYANDKQVLAFVKKLNAYGLVIYIDWISDRNGLQRNQFSKATLDVLHKRMEQSKVLICLYTKEAISSSWIPWEISYFLFLNKKVFIYNPFRLELLKDYINYPEIENQDTKWIIPIDGIQYDFKEWLKK